MIALITATAALVFLCCLLRLVPRPVDVGM
jgi:hypothetical protein